MDLKQISLQNFQAIESKQTLDLDNRGLTLITGINSDTDALTSNGSGKSTFLEGIIYALYGQDSQGFKGDNLVRNSVGKDLQVYLKFVQNNIEYEIYRYRKDSTYKNKTLFYQAGKEITGKSIKATNELIQEVIGLDLNTYLHSYMFGLGEKVNFTSASDKEKKEILENIANLSIYPQAQQIAKDKLKDVNTEIALKNGKIENTEIVIQNYKDLAKKSQDQLKKVLVQKEELSKQIEQQTQELLDEQTVQEYKEQISQSKKEVQQLQPTISNYSELQNQKQHLIQELNDENSALTIKKQELDNLKQQNVQVMESFNTTKQTYVSIANGEQTKCLYCGQPLNEEHKQQELTNLKDKLLDLKKQSKTLLQQYSKKAQEVNFDKRDQLTNKVETFSLPDIAETSNRIQTLNQLQNKFQTTISNNQHKQELIKSSQSSLESLKGYSSVNTYEEEIKSSKDELEGLQNELKSMNRQKELLENVVNIYSDRGVKSQVLDLVLPYVNKQANFYLQLLTDGTITVKVSPTTESKNGNESEKINVEVNNLNGSNDYKKNSTGEQKRIDVSISLALQDYVMSQTNTKANLIAYDEIFDGLDGVGIERIIQLLSKRIKEIPSIFVISHRDELKDLFENTITANKSKGITTYS